MTSRQADAVVLVGRVRRVGWPVVQMGASNTWKVTCPDKFRVQIHATGERNATKQALELLNDHGFAQAELAAKRAEEAERKAKLAAERERNARRTAKVAKMGAAVAKAAGPYAPAQPTIQQILAKHPAPQVFHRVLVTPEMAKAMLERNLHNRPLRRADIAEWSTVLRTGRWRYMHQGVAFDTDGKLQDGQHRLFAIAESGVAAELMISVGMPADNFAVVDTGRKRSASQVLAMGGVKNASWLSGAVRLLFLFEAWGHVMLDHTRDRVGNDLVMDLHAKLDDDDLQAACVSASRLRSELLTGPSGPIAAFYLIRRACAPDYGPADRFMEALIHGANEDSEPVLFALRRRLVRQKVGATRPLLAPEIMALILKGWNLKLTSGSPKVLGIREGSAVPQPRTPGQK